MTTLGLSNVRQMRHEIAVLQEQAVPYAANGQTAAYLEGLADADEIISRMWATATMIDLAKAANA